ncbi:MAG: EF-hand domain-containing protein [Novosphingobium sp.]
MNKFTLGVAVASLAAAGGAYALEARDSPQHIAEQDRIITRADAETRAGSMFDRLDANRDGKLDPADRAAHQAQMFDRIDRDHNGQISRAEFTGFHGAGPDGGGDHGPMGMGGDPMRPGGSGGRHGHGHHGPDGGGMMMMMGRMADANGDGSVSRAEFVAAGLRRFDAADANHDGKLSPAERQAAHRSMAERMGGGWEQHGAAASPSPSDPAPR